MPNWVLLLVSSLREKVTFNARYRDSPVMNARLFTAYHSIFLTAACSYHFLAPEGSTTLPGLMSRALSPYQLHPIMAPLPEPVLRVPKALHKPACRRIWIICSPFSKISLAVLPHTVISSMYCKCSGSPPCSSAAWINPWQMVGLCFHPWGK